VDLHLRPPGSRSLTNRVLLAAALAPGSSCLLGAGENDDTRAMREGLGALGVTIQTAGDRWQIQGRGGHLEAPARPLDVGASGTTARFLTAAATLAEGAVEIDGAPRMRERPIAELVSALSALGAPGKVLGEGGCPPLRMAGGGLPGGRAVIDASRSSQFVSAILLVAPCARRDVELQLAGGRLVSRRFVDLTLEAMTAFGARAGWTREGALRVEAGVGYRPRRYAIEPDAQSAVYAFAAAALTGGRSRIEGIPAGSTQTDLAVLEVLEAMGCTVQREARAVLVQGPPGGRLRGVQADMNQIPDAVLAVAVLALFASGPSLLRNIAHLRLKESDRLAALERELQRLGGRVEIREDALAIEPGPLHGGVVETYDDHRMAMAFAVAGLRLPGVRIRNPGCVRKTWPAFFQELERW